LTRSRQYRQAAKFGGSLGPRTRVCPFVGFADLSNLRRSPTDRKPPRQCACEREEALRWGCWAEMKCSNQKGIRCPWDGCARRRNRHGMDGCASERTPRSPKRASRAPCRCAWPRRPITAPSRILRAANKGLCRCRCKRWGRGAACRASTASPARFGPITGTGSFHEWTRRLHEPAGSYRRPTDVLGVAANAGSLDLLKVGMQEQPVGSLSRTSPDMPAPGMFCGSVH
jgi:hypothetical protein